MSSDIREMIKCSFNCYIGEEFRHLSELPNTWVVENDTPISSVEFEEKEFPHLLKLIEKNDTFLIYEDTTFGGFIVTDHGNKLYANIAPNLMDGNLTPNKIGFFYGDDYYILDWNGIYKEEIFFGI